MSRITLITGGARSGKSIYALRLAAGKPRACFVATARALDAEMATRIAHHRETRPAEFRTIEESVNVVSALVSLDSSADVIVLDCLTLWIANLMEIYVADEPILGEADRLAHAIRSARYDSVVVSGEVGSGIVPENTAARRFRDLLGWTNQKIAAVADEVILMVAGYPVRAK
ncbi:MAG TPA: bifunctional adenosylcobinamide kinase/adenosylcobinamide-phosphate guanylyltransferase [Candidatus Binataceae bacterium]